MTQIASFDLGAAAAKRPNAPNLGASKGHGDFMAAFRQAATEARKQDRAQDADRAAEARAERDRDTGSAEEADEAYQANDSQPTERAEKPRPVDQDKAQAKQAAADAPVKPQAPADKPAEATTDAAPASEAPEAPVAEAPAEPQPALDAQTVLALQLATGGQVAQPVVQTQLQAQAVTEAATEAVDHALEVSADAESAHQAQARQAETQAAAQADRSTRQAMTDALRQAQAQAQAEPVKAQAQANGLATAQATAHAQANAQAQSPAFLAAAARDLGGITMQVSTARMETPTAPVAPVAEAPAETTNLSIVLNALETQTHAKGPIAPVTMLDGADGTEMPSPVPGAEDDADAAIALTADAEQAPVAAAAVGDRGVADSAKAAAKAPELPVRPEDVMPQVSRHLEQLKANQANAIKLQLYPEHLGKMEIKVVSHQGVLSAQLTADSHAVKGMLESQVAQLQRTFAEMGLKVDKVEVTIASSQMNFDAQGQAAQQGDAQAFGRQGSNQQTFKGSGYQQWLGDEPVDEGAYAQLDQAAVDYVA